MADLEEMVDFLDHELGTAAISDYSGAVNGLQLGNGGMVDRVVAAVDASLPVVRRACEGGGGLLVVHHGLFWQGLQPLTGPLFEKVKCAMDAGLAIYSSHLPLDVHPQWGNNVRLAEAIGLSEVEPFLERRGFMQGLRGRWIGTRAELQTQIATAVGGAVHCCPGGADRIESVAIITGGAGSEVAEVAAAGVDAFVTGEGPHWSYPLAEELRLNVFYAGHYATETFGVKALGQVLADRYQVGFEFIDHPTGL